MNLFILLLTHHFVSSSSWNNQPSFALYSDQHPGRAAHGFMLNCTNREADDGLCLRKLLFLIVYFKSKSQRIDFSSFPNLRFPYERQSISQWTIYLWYKQWMAVCTKILFKILPIQLMMRLKIADDIQLTKPKGEFLINCIVFITSIYLATRKAAFFLTITELRRHFFFHSTPQPFQYCY